MRIRRQLLLVAAAAALVAVAVVAGLAYMTGRNAATFRAQAQSQEIARNVASLLTLTQEFMLYGGARSTAQWHARYAQLVAAVEAAHATDSAVHPALLELREHAADIAPLFGRLEATVRAPPSEFAQRQRELIVERLLSDSQELVEARHRWALAIGERQASDQQLSAAIVLLGPAALLLVAFSLGVVVWRRVLLPLGGLQAAATAIRGGDLQVRADTGARDELGDTARAVDAMAESLRAANAGLQAEVAQRRDVQLRLRLVIDNVPVLIGYIDAERRYATVNQAYADWHARPQDQVLGQRVDAVNSPHTYAQLAPQLQRAFAGEAVDFEVEVQRLGLPHAMRIAYVPDRGADGSVAGVFSMKLDVTPLRRAERQLRAVMESSPLGMFVADAAGACRYTNPAWQQIAGLSQGESLGAGWRTAVHPDDRERIFAEWDAAATEGRPQASEYRYRRPDGSTVWVRGHIAPIHGDDYAEGVVGTVEDVSARRELDRALAARTAELARSNEELERFAYVASHDLQEPLRMVTSYGQLLRRRHRAQLGAEAQEFLDYVVDGGQRAQALIADLLSLARVASRAQPMQPLALDTALDDALRPLRLLIAETGATITHDPLPVVDADARQIGQLWHNLIGNALKFRGSEPPRIHIGARREGRHWRIGVADNGIGIEPRFFERIFVIFQRLHLRADYEGTGIGLALCKKVVERHGGRIGVESQPGKGSTFFFTIPVQRHTTHPPRDTA